MTESLIRTKLNSTLQIKSLKDLIRVKVTSETAFLALDASGSMSDKMRNGKRRIDGLREITTGIGKQRTVKMVIFSGDGAWPSTSIPEPRGGTPLDEGIRQMKLIGAGRCIVISDGIPNDRKAALDAAKDFGGQIDVVFVGDPGDEGEEFLRSLAQSTGGTEFHGDLSEPKALTASILGLLGNGEDEDEKD